jgi:hypothetical protein
MTKEEREAFDAELLSEPARQQPSVGAAGSILQSPDQARGMETLMGLMALPQA